MRASPDRRLVVFAEGNDAGEHHRTPVVHMELVRDSSVVANHYVALRSVDIQQHFLGQGPSRHGDLTFIDTTIRYLNIFDLKFITLYHLWCNPGVASSTFRIQSRLPSL